MMNRKILLLVSVMIIWGCGGLHKATLNPTPSGGIDIESSSYGILPPPSAEELARAAVDLALAKNIKDQSNGNFNFPQNANENKSFAVPVRVRNESRFPLEVTTGEFSGAVLDVGEKSHTKLLSLGVCSFNVRFATDSGGIMEWKVSRIITKKTREIVLRDTRK